MHPRSISRSARARAAAVLFVAAAPLLVACADDSTASSVTEPAAAAADDTDTEVAPTGVVHEVTALDNSFRPDSLEVAVGDEVVWVNGGRNEHDVLTVEGDDWGVTVDDFQPGDEYRHVFGAPGEYRYYCSIHGTTTAGMIGTVVVTG